MKKLKGKKTEKNLQIAFARESNSRVKYEIYAKKAKEEGYDQVACFFEQTAINEFEHATIWHELLNEGIENTENNLLDCISDENYEWVTMYVDFAREAREEGFNEIAQMFEGIAKIEKDHEERYQRLFDNIRSGRVFKKDIDKTWVCAKCGYKYKSKIAPKSCPICNYSQASFMIYNDDY